jgi:hypothetical protein
MTFIELVRRACEESGTVPQRFPESIVGAPGIVSKWVKWVQSAWVDIQTAETSWKWMRAEGEGPILVGQNRFTPGDLGATRFGTWRPRSDRGWPLWTLYDPDRGIADEGEVRVDPYDLVARSARGEVQTGRPEWFAIDDEMRLFVWPWPDKEYRLRYSYNRAPQVLAVDGEVPEMPAHHHELIVYRALLKGAIYDEAPSQFPYWQAEAARMMHLLRDTQLPALEWGGPLVRGTR